MKKIHLSATSTTPEVILDLENNIFVIKGVSIPDYTADFYRPICNCCEESLINLKGKIQIEISLTAINTASNMMLLNILSLFEDYNSKNEIMIKWFYCNSEFLEMGEEYAELLDVIRFEFYKQ